MTDGEPIGLIKCCKYDTLTGNVGTELFHLFSSKPNGDTNVAKPENLEQPLNIEDSTSAVYLVAHCMRKVFEYTEV